MEAMRTKGSSIAGARSRTKLSGGRGRSGEGEPFDGSASKGKGEAGEARKRLGIDAGAQRDENRSRQRNGLAERHLRTDGVSRFGQPGMFHQAEVVIQRRDNVEHAKYSQPLVFGFDKREKNIVLSEKAGGRRHA